ncbi:MAG: tetratricopeptide repeat protein [Candidatus Methylumidiphilus sp.]
MKFPKFNNLSIWEQLGVIASIIGIISFYFYFADKSSTKTDSGNQNQEINTGIKIDGNVSDSNIAGHDLIIQNPSPEAISQIVTTLTKNHKLDVQVKDEQIKALTEAVTALSKGQGIDVSPADRDAAFSALKQGNTKLAKSLFARIAEKAEQPAKQGAEAYRNLGALAFLDNTQEALQAYRRATQLDPDNADGWNQLGLILRRVGDMDAAIAAYNKALALGNQHLDPKEIATASGNLGNVYQIRGNLDKAIEFYQKALQLDKGLNDKEGMANDYGSLGIVYQIHGDLDKAIEFYQRALKLNEGLGTKEVEASTYGNLGLVYQMRGDLEKAIEYFQKALKLNEDLVRKQGVAENYANIGVVRELQGKKIEAKRYYSKSLELFTQLNHPYAKKVQTLIDGM